MSQATGSASKSAFRNIGLMGRPGKRVAALTLQQVYHYLQQRGLNAIFDEATAEWVGMDHIQTISRHLLGEACDLVIVVGGDGTLLHAARALARTKTPVLGINRGRLGFLADIRPQDMFEKLDHVFDGHYHLENRFLLELEVKKQGAVRYEAVALNDMVLHAGKSVHMMEFELHIDGVPVYEQHSDGLIIATPTGSTAYALSAGGPILHPRMDAIVLVPMNPHNLSSRPIVVAGESEIKLKMLGSLVDPMVSADGQQGFKLELDDVLSIRKHPFKLSLLHPPGYDFYAACRTKLGWNIDLENHELDDEVISYLSKDD